MDFLTAFTHFGPAFVAPGETLPALEPEFTFAPPRRWKADFRLGAVLIEIDGAIWTRGRHTRGQGFLNDCVKLNRATELGYRVLRYPTDLLATDPQAVIGQVIATWRATIR